MLEINTVVNDFALLDSNNNEVKLSDFKGKKVVVYFYPKDNTPGCTTQACSFKDRIELFQDRNCVVIGISKDNDKSHQKFIAKYDLPFILLQDVDTEVMQYFGVWKEKILFGKKYMGCVRATFIIDEMGKIIKVFEKANPSKNAGEIIDFLDNQNI